MRILLLFSSALFFFSLNAFAQHWEDVVGGVHGRYEGEPPEVSSIVSDSIHHLLYVGGIFDSAGDVQSRNLAFWNGTRWISSEAQFGYGAYINIITAMILFHDTLIFAGPYGVGRWIDTTYGAPVTPQLTGVTSLAIFHDTLFAGKNSAVYQYTGETWKLIGKFEANSVSPEIHSMAVYNDQLIVGGLFRTIDKVSCNNIASWDGKAWHPLGGGTRWSVSSLEGTVYSLASYKGELYAAGSFDTAGDVHCYDIARWNGSKWDSVGPKTICGNTYTMVANDSFLYVGGGLFGVDQYCKILRVGKWDGANWYNLNLDIDLDVYSVAFFDDELYAAGRFYLLNDTTAHGIVKYVNDIATTVVPIMTEKLKIFPNLTNDYFSVNNPIQQAARLFISDIYGRIVKSMILSSSSNNTKVDVRDLTIGTYLVTLQTALTRTSQKLVITTK
ncbi:MAG: T9SS type A sorting domain-containing protein [Chitinophagales bacterium]|nr:T9SS type A sorting domain-containing protein [Chitinophagales bacterium]